MSLPESTLNRKTVVVEDNDFIEGASSVPFQRAPGSDGYASHSLPGLVALFVNILKPELRQERSSLIAGWLLAAVASAIGLLAPYFLQEIVDHAIALRDQALFWKYTGLLCCAFASFFILWGLQIRLTVRATQSIFLSFKNRLVSLLLRKPMIFFDHIGRGDLMTRFANDLELLTQFFHENVIRASAYVIFVLCIAVFLLTWHWRLGLISLLALPAYLTAIHFIHRPVEARSQEARQRLSSQNSVLLDILQGIREIRFFQQEEMIRSLFHETARAYAGASRRSFFARDWSLNLVEGLGLLVTFAPVLAGGYMMIVGKSDLSTGVLLAYFSYLAYLTTTLVAVIISLTRLAEAAPVLHRIREIIEFSEEPHSKTTDVRDTPDSFEVTFDGVGFEYPNGKQVLRDLNLTIREGEKVAVMGPSGSGKSTLVNLLLRFLRPTRGRILLGGRDIQSYGLPIYLSFFSLVSQTTHLFQMSVRENIALGWYHIPFDIVENAAKLVQMDEVMRQLPQGYDTILGQGGMDLSGGQKQRLAVARAVIRDPAVLVLDEFTSALDRKVEEEILQDLLRLFRRQTLICITHSENVARHFDRVVRLQQL